MDLQQRYTNASVKTANDLRTIAHSETIRELSTLSLPEIEAVVELVARIIPAGNVPGVILNGLARLPGRRPPLKTVRRDVNLLFTGIEQYLDKALYSAIFAGPAAVIWGYQNLLKLAGKDPADSFPEGLWQFYADYALREDTARHANETHGFDTILVQHQLKLSQSDRLTAWIMAAIHILHQYDDLLKNEWRERVYTYLLREITHQEPEADQYAHLYHDWSKQRPYGRGQDAASTQSYPSYRRIKFDRFLEAAMAPLRPELRRQWVAQARQAKERDLPTFQRQMSMLAYLEPGPYGESRIQIPLKEAHIGLIYQGHYARIPACAPHSSQPANVTAVRKQVAAWLNQAHEMPPANLTPLASVKRSAWPDLKQQLNPSLVEALEKLRLAPILLNAGPQPVDQPLSELRQAERGIGDQPLTLFDTGQTMVFDQSHIFFDGAWGAALAEILTQEALAWGSYLSRQPAVEPEASHLQRLTFSFKAPGPAFVQQAPRVTPEVGAETDLVDLKAMLRLRRLFKRRNDLIELTVNDLLVLYRAIHAAVYQPAAELVSRLQTLRRAESSRFAAQTALAAIEPAQPANPAMVIPVDASQRSPQDRLYPMTFEVPLAELNLLTLHEQVMTGLNTYEGGGSRRSELYKDFDRLQRIYLASLAGVGAVLSRAKEIAIAGESANVGTIKLLAHMPTPLQRMLDKIPNRFDVLNDLIKGREVFSNVGAVAPSSTLTRFITAKDDNDKKTLAWGVLTDAQGVMRITLRDFRPHVAQLEAVGQAALAKHLVQDYLESYARGLNTYIDDLHRITATSRETGLVKLEKNND